MDRLERHHAHYLLHVRLSDLAPLVSCAYATGARHGVAAVVEQVREVPVRPDQDDIRREDLYDTAVRYGERQ